MATIPQIAKLAGVSIGTVDRVLHNRGYVKEETRKKVEKAMDELDYKPNQAAQGLAIRKKKIKFLFMIPKTKFNPFFIDVKNSALKKAKELEKYAVKTDILDYPDNKTDEKKLLSDLKKSLSDYDGVCIMSKESALNDFLIAEHEKQKFPLVFYNTKDNKEPDFAYVGCDYKAAGKMAAGLTALIGGEDAKLCFFSEINDIKESSEERIAGFLEEAKEKYPKMEICGRWNITSDRKTNEKNVDEMLSKTVGKKIVYVVNPRDYDICRIIAEKDKEKSVKIITNDLVEVQHEMFKLGIISATICQEPEKQGEMPLDILFNYLAYGIKPERINYTNLEIKILQSIM